MNRRTLRYTGVILCDILRLGNQYNSVQVIIKRASCTPWKKKNHPAIFIQAQGTNNREHCVFKQSKTEVLKHDSNPISHLHLGIHRRLRCSP